MHRPTVKATKSTRAIDNGRSRPKNLLLTLLQHNRVCSQYRSLKLIAFSKQLEKTINLLNSPCGRQRYTKNRTLDSTTFTPCIPPSKGDQIQSACTCRSDSSTSRSSSFAASSFILFRALMNTRLQNSTGGTAAARAATATNGFICGSNV